MSRGWLSALVRARQVQEDTARGRLADADRRTRTAYADLARRDAHIDSLTTQVDVTMTAPAFVAAAAALHSAAAVRSAAAFALDQAQLTTATRSAELRAAATARGAAERLHERTAAEARARLAYVEQRQMDEQAARLQRTRQAEQP